MTVHKPRSYKTAIILTMVLLPVLLISIPIREAAAGDISAIPTPPKKVPAIPNKTLIEGIVLEYSILSSEIVGIKPQQVLYRLSVLVTSARDVAGMGSFVKEGSYIQVYSKDIIPPYIFGRVINATVVYRGDERGGKFWIYDIRIKKRTDYNDH